MSDLLTVYEAAEFIGVTPKALYLAIEEHRIASVKLLGKFGISKEEAKRFKKSREASPTNGNGKVKAA